MIACLCVLALGMTAASARSLEEIKASGELRLCVAGSSHELYTMTGKAFAESLGVVANVTRLGDWDEQFHHADGVTDKEGAYTPHLMETGACDVYPNDLVIIEWRQKKLDFAVLYHTRMTVVINKSNQGKIKSETDLRGRRAAVMEGTTYHSWMAQKNSTDFADDPIQLTFMPTNDSMLAVDNQQADFTVIGANGALTWTRHKVKNSAVGFFVGPVTQVGWGFRKGDTDLLEAADLFFESQRRLNSRFDEIWKEKVGMTLSEFNVFISSVAGD